MKSRTSFFNAGVLKKDILRFAPLWGSYTVLMLLYLFLTITATELSGEGFLAMAEVSTTMMGFINFFLGGFAALLLFGDLFKSRLCNAIHALPLRREGWFLTHFAAGMLFCIVPNTLGAAIAALNMGPDGFLAWAWLGMTVLQYLCFFSLGILSVQLAGTAFGAISVYFIINFLWALISGLILCFYAPVLFGVDLESFLGELCLLSPALRLDTSRYIQIEYNYENFANITQFKGFVSGDWTYLFIAAAACVVLLVCALLLYRKRHLETAGDLLAVKAAKPVFLVLYTLYVTAGFYLISSIAEDATISILMSLVGLAVGFFTGWMILEKRLKVFSKKRFIGLGILGAIFGLSLLLTWLDPAGITRYVPPTDKVESVTISPYMYNYYDDRGSCTLKDPADIDAIRAIHGQLVQERNEDAENLPLTITYQLADGGTVKRKYYVQADSQIAKDLAQYYSRVEAVFGTEDVMALLRGTQSMEFYGYSLNLPSISFYYGQENPQDYAADRDHISFSVSSYADDPKVLGLLAAIQQDCVEGKMAQNAQHHTGYGTVGRLEINSTTGPHSYLYTDITIYGDCTNTITFLKHLAEQGQK